MPNSLMGEAGLKVGPIVLETLIQHYFERIKHNANSEEGNEKGITQLRQDEILYDQAFSIVKAFLVASSKHTIEELQEFSNTRTPSPPWVRVVRLLVPMSSCNEASTYLVKALGGEEVARRVVGGTKWWQVRGLDGVDAQWITAKKDWREAKKRQKELNGKSYRPASAKGLSSDTQNGPEESGQYQKDMDEMRCILYAHGGGYYFGSVDQERYAIQRYARKINGRVFAVNYRLAPQYPVPCGIQDMVAAYLFLIKPPPGAAHCPVKPAHIIVSGDSAGGGLTLALLQVIRDSGLPMPSGGVLVSPWCDMTHSFPSIHTNTSTDIIPPYGLSMHKPSTLWPPPSEELSCRVHAGLRSRIRQALRPDHTVHDHPASDLASHIQHSKSGSTSMPVNVGTTTQLPHLDSLRNQTISLVTESGETLTIEQQIQFYSQNSLLGHPLVSPAISYLGGLCPLLYIASDKEVLRDEIIYTAHRAAYPEKFPLRDETRKLYPNLIGIENRYEPTPVHLQVYDDTAHVLPVLFAFTTPGKFCYRAIATFCKHVTGMHVTPTSLGESSSTSLLNSLSTPPTQSSLSLGGTAAVGPSPKKKKSLPKLVSSNFARVFRWNEMNSASSKSVYRPEVIIPPVPPLPATDDIKSPASPIPLMPRENSDVAGPRFRVAIPSTQSTGTRTAGDPIVYNDTSEYPSWNHGMIRERVSTQGFIRPLEPDAELAALCIPHELVGVLSELTIRRYLDGKAKFDKKFSGTMKTIDKRRNKNLERSKNETVKKMAELQHFLVRGDDLGNGTEKGIKKGLTLASGSWSWAWALDAEERPPPSSIVSRRDTSEARRLARIADQSEEASISANNLWSIVTNYLTASPDHHENANKVSSSSKEKGRNEVAAGHDSGEFDGVKVNGNGTAA